MLLRLTEETWSCWEGIPHGCADLEGWSTAYGVQFSWNCLIWSFMRNCQHERNTLCPSNGESAFPRMWNSPFFQTGHAGRVAMSMSMNSQELNGSLNSLPHPNQMSKKIQFKRHLDYERWLALILTGIFITHLQNHKSKVRKTQQWRKIWSPEGSPLSSIKMMQILHMPRSYW